MTGSSPQLRRLDIKAYRSCKDTTFEPNLGLSVLIGRNGAGKTNILRGIHLMTRVFKKGANSRGPLLRTILQSEFSIGDTTAQNVETIHYRTNQQNLDDLESSKEKWRFKTSGRWSGWRELSPYKSDQGPNNEELRRSPKRKVNLLRPSDYALIREVGLYCRSCKYYTASEFSDPSRCHPAFEVDQTDRLEFVGEENAPSRFVFDLFQSRESNQKRYDAFIDLVGKAGLGLIDKIEWKKIRISSTNYALGSGARVTFEKQRRLLIVPRITIGRSQLSFNQLSEGTFRTLALLFYLEASDSQLLLIEEPEVGIHHGLLNKVIEIIQAAALRKQIVCSTHSDYVLDALRPEQVFVVTNSARHGTLIDRVPDYLSAKGFRALKSYLEAEGNLGDYWRHGGLDK